MISKTDSTFNKSKNFIPDKLLSRLTADFSVSFELPMSLAFPSRLKLLVSIISSLLKG